MKRLKQIDIYYKNMNKNLADKAIDLKGKKYVLVSDRVIYFNEAYPEGSITTELVSPVDADTVVIKATIRPGRAIAVSKDGVVSSTIVSDRAFTGYSQATWGEGFVNKTSALENAETSAVGRALAFMGIGVLDSIASIDEINKTQYPVRPSMKKSDTQLKSKDAAENDMGDVEIISI